jgi:DNA-binding response OmpR family regulator
MKKILLADDDASIRQMLGAVLELEHYEVMRACTGREAAATFVADIPELVLLDLNMPDRNGWDVFELMHRTHPSVPVIIITAVSRQQRRAADLGVTLMEKPLDIPLLLEMIRERLGESEAERMRRLNGAEFGNVETAAPASHSRQ